jgi:RimJ/RimL family protein N-acetyltransferase
VGSVTRLEGERVALRPFGLDDASEVQRLAAAPEIAATTLGIPHPYPDGAAQEWIERQAANPAMHHFAVTLSGSGELIGAIGLDIEEAHGRGELGYWIGFGTGARAMRRKPRGW